MIGNRAFWLGIFISAVLLAVFLLVFTDLRTLGEVLKSANYIYVIPATILYFFAVQFRTMRWGYLLSPLMGKSRRSLFKVVVVGYMANNLIPVRIGELVRSYYLARREKVSTAGALGTVAVERAADVITLFVFLAISFYFLPITGVIKDLVDVIPGGYTVLITVSLAPVIGLAIVISLLMVVSKDKAMYFIGWGIRVFPASVRSKLTGLIENLIDGFTVINSFKALGVTLVYSLPVWILEGSMYYLIAMGFDLRPYFDSHLEFIAAILMFTSIANLAGVLPSSAGSWGPFDFFGAAALIALGLPGTIASGFALTVHVVLWVPVTVMGIGILIMEGTSLSRLVNGLRNEPDSGNKS